MWTVLAQPAIPGLEPDELDVFRPIQYLGCKIRLLDAIADTLRDVAVGPGRYLDLFCGSGVVSRRLASERAVTAIDIQEFARVLSSALLHPSRRTMPEVRKVVDGKFASASTVSLFDAMAPLLDHEEAAVATLDVGALSEVAEVGSLALGGSVSRSQDLARAVRLVLNELGSQSVCRRAPLARHYAGPYFSYRQALELDLLLEVSDEMPRADRDTWIAAILGAASDCVSSVGSQFAQPIAPRSADGRTKPHAIKLIQRKRSMSVVDRFFVWLERYEPRDDPHGHEIRRCDYGEFLDAYEGTVAATYADPPYTRDHYSRFYHVLETIALADDPRLGRWAPTPEDTTPRGMYRRERHQSPFCIKSLAPAAFDRLFGGVRRLGTPLVVSYSPYSEDRPSHPRLLTIKELSDRAARYFSRTYVVPVGSVTHSKMNASHRNFGVTQDAEILLVCKP